MEEVILSILGGLILFLYAVQRLSGLLQGLGDDRIKDWILRFTPNFLAAVVTGAVVTTILDSSSAVIIITIVFVNAKLLTFRQAMGIVLGANIGTTVSSQIIAMDIGKYSPIILLLGFFMMIISQSGQMGKIGQVILTFGILFFGLFTMEKAVEPLRESEIFKTWLSMADQPLYGAGFGALITLVIQSSSATVGMSIILCKKSLLSVTGGTAVMLGAELGTCSDTLLATINGSRSALKTGVFHISFNLLCLMLGLILFVPFTSLVMYISQNAEPGRQLANAHMIFNILGVILIFPFLKPIENLLHRLLPDKS